MQPAEVAVPKCFVEKEFLEISQNSQENTCTRVSFLINLQAKACNFVKKETLAQVFSCQVCEIFKNTSFYRIPPVEHQKNNARPLIVLATLLISIRVTEKLLHHSKKTNYSIKWRYI